MTLLHLALAHDWRRALGTGTYDISTRGATIDEVGYMHCCGSREQLDGVARRFYSDVTEPLFVIDIDEAALIRLGRTVRREAAPDTAQGTGVETFPHVYGGPLPVSAVAEVTSYVFPGA